MAALVKRLANDVKDNIYPILLQFESEYTRDAYASVLEQALLRLQEGYVSIALNAKVFASEFVGNTNNVNKAQFYSAMEKATGVDIRSVVQNENLDDILTAVTRENVSLIKSIPDEYFKKIETAIFTGTTQGSNARSLIEEIQKIGRVTTSRAKLIARDQTSKINSALTQQRAQNLGSEEYTWRTAGDERVRESHKVKNGKVYRWDDPPKDTGHPGHDIQCRCVAQPIIKI